VARFGSIGAALRSNGQSGVSNKEREQLKPAPETPREIGERRKALAKLYPKPKARSDGPGVVLPADAPQKRSERRKLIKQLARQAKGGVSAS